MILTVSFLIIVCSPLNTALISKYLTSLSVLFILPNRLTYVHPCTPVIPLVPSDSPTLISSLLRLSSHHLDLSVSALQPLQSGTLPLSLDTGTSPDTFCRHLKTHYRPSDPLNPSPLAPQIRLLLTILRIYKLHFLAYLFR